MHCFEAIRAFVASHRFTYTQFSEQSFCALLYISVHLLVYLSCRLYIVRNSVRVCMCAPEVIHQCLHCCMYAVVADTGADIQHAASPKKMS
jgi:hypothetical protein